jgi:hypothetical protein
MEINPIWIIENFVFSLAIGLEIIEGLHYLEIFFKLKDGPTSFSFICYKLPSPTMNHLQN